MDYRVFLFERDCAICSRRQRSIDRNTKKSHGESWVNGSMRICLIRSKTSWISLRMGPTTDGSEGTIAQRRRKCKDYGPAWVWKCSEFISGLTGSKIIWPRLFAGTTWTEIDRCLTTRAISFRFAWPKRFEWEFKLINLESPFSKAAARTADLRRS